MRTTARTLAAAFAVVAVVVVLAGGLAGAQKEYETLPFKDDFGTAELVYSGGYRIADKVINLRRKLHAVPGVMYEEYEASRIVLSALKSMGIKDSNIETGLGVTGVIAHIGFGSLAMSKEDSEIPTIVLRADMDALPIHEETDVPFKSTVPGVMHACGHDAHTAMLLGAAMALKAVEEELITMKAAVRLFFQPAEECGAGAKAMIDEGAIEGADDAIMLHVANNLDTGVIAVKVCLPAQLSPPRPPRRRRRLTCAPRPPPSPKPGLMLYVCPPPGGGTGPPPPPADPRSAPAATQRRVLHVRDHRHGRRRARRASARVQRRRRRDGRHHLGHPPDRRAHGRPDGLGGRLDRVRPRRAGLQRHPRDDGARRHHQAPLEGQVRGVLRHAHDARPGHRGGVRVHRGGAQQGRPQAAERARRRGTSARRSRGAPLARRSRRLTGAPDVRPPADSSPSAPSRRCTTTRSSPPSGSTWRRTCSARSPR